MKLTFISIAFSVTAFTFTSCSSGSTTPANSAITDTVTDIDGNIYHTITIGKQTWMLENLKTTHYRNGTAIPNVTDSAQWSDLYLYDTAANAYCDYNNDTANGSIYGHLYNWYAVNNPAGLCPAGWHVPTDSEWTVLSTYLGGDSIAGGAMKDTILWQSPSDSIAGLAIKDTTLLQRPNAESTNSSGFSGLPGGSREEFGSFGEFGIGHVGCWWSSSEYSTNEALACGLYFNFGFIDRGYDLKGGGHSIRCLKN
ncbi:MAG: fibrobacter succinogenes major paralogous domain-containing protein [Ferruginibacter sp.]